MWGLSCSVIESELKGTHEILPECQSTNIMNFGGNFLDTVSFYLKGNGGLWLSHSKGSKLLFKKRIVFNFSATKSKKGILLCLFDVSHLIHKPNKHLFIFHTHLGKNKNKNLLKLITFICQSRSFWVKILKILQK